MKKHIVVFYIGFGAYVVGWFVGYSHDKVIVEHRVETIHINHWIATNSLELSLNQLPEDLFKANLYTVLGAHKIDKDSELGFILCDYAIKQLHNLTNINK